MLALKLLTPEQFFAQLYAHADVEFEPSSGGRMMNNYMNQIPEFIGKVEKLNKPDKFKL